MLSALLIYPHRVKNDRNLAKNLELVTDGNVEPQLLRVSFLA